MRDTYCGKCCEGCAFAQELNCPGCKTEQYSPVSAQCAIAICCKKRGHEHCDTCTFNAACPNLSKRDVIPQVVLQARAELLRRKQAETEARAREQAQKLESSAVLGKWLWLLFWLVVPSELGALLIRGEGVMHWIGLSLTTIAALAYGLILLKLDDEHYQYRSAGICTLITAAVSTVVAIAFLGEPPSWTLLITLPAAVVNISSMYLEFHAHSDVLESFDRELSEKWLKLWKYHVYAFGILFGAIFLLLLAPVLALIAVIGGAVAIIVIYILRLVYLYRTAQVFRKYSVSAASQDN